MVWRLNSFTAGLVKAGGSTLPKHSVNTKRVVEPFLASDFLFEGGVTAEETRSNATD